ncbi:amidase family protein [uncultured Eudoraea sp.]|uniref:amidase family protein n=1 Tax=uncultured Eudoraea sp. TaxID=1035614 RepID=UPI00260FC2E4|nr:amidase family protein [uncultured Eudoraea sp.]
MKKLIFLLGLLLIISCKESKKVDYSSLVLWKTYNDSSEVAASQEHEKSRMRFKLIQSRVSDKNEIFRPLYHEVAEMSETDYEQLKPLILEQDIPTIQGHIKDGKLTYEKLVRFFLYRIYRFELDNKTTLHTILALNENVVEEARELDNLISEDRHPIFGMPIFLKDNIGTAGMNTTAGSIALKDNETEDAFIVRQLKKNKALIMGKVNLSEWAYYMCNGCPLGYSAIGGQTLNPYGRGIFETGGSSAGSGTSVAANYAVAAVGTETSGSILSPSSLNSVVGLKPTIGLLSRSGIVPISSTLDTPGPMTKNVIDNAILLSAMTGKDMADDKSVSTDEKYFEAVLNPVSLKGKRLGVFKDLLETDSIYGNTINKLKKLGAEIIEFNAPEVSMDGFLTLLNIDMKNDLPEYLSTNIQNKEVIPMRTMEEIVEFNLQDSLLRIPYGQSIFDGILKDSTTLEELEVIKSRLEKNGRLFFDTAMDQENLDAILSINNYHAGYAAVAKYPALTIPMGYKETGEPISLTFIAKPFHENDLLGLGRAFEIATKIRKPPLAYN